MSLTNTYERDTLDELFGDTGITGATHYIGLVEETGDIEEDGTVTNEVTGGDYERLQVDNDATTWPAATTNGDDITEKKNGIDMEFVEATADWGTITKFFIATSSTGDGDDVISYGDLVVSRDIKEGDIARLKTGELVITLD